MAIQNEKEKKAKEIIHELQHTNNVTIRKGRVEILLKEKRAKKALLLSAVVYRGEGYIPPSVRKCVDGPPPYSQAYLDGSLSIQEESFEIVFYHEALLSELNIERLDEQLDEFAYLAEMWMDYLDENDKRDLVYVK